MDADEGLDSVEQERNRVIEDEEHNTKVSGIRIVGL